MLVMNGTSYTANPAKFFATTQSLQGNLQTVKAGSHRSGLTGYGSTTRTDASKKFLASVPNGYGADGWLMPFTAGGMSTFGLLSGTGALSGSGAMGVNISASFGGTGAFSADGKLVVSGSATLTGSGSLTANAVGALFAQAALTGSGSLTATMNAIGHMASALAGSGTVSPTISALGHMAALIEVGAQTELTASDVALEILDSQLVETGLTVRETLRVVAAALAGKVSGAAGTSITFRSAEADHKDRIVATVDADGNRSAVTLDVSD